MAAYLISLDPEGEWYSEPEKMAEYGQNVPALVEAFGGRYLLMRQDAEVLEGEWDPGPIVLVEFDSKKKLLEFYHSEEYRPWLELRKRCGSTRIVIAER
jgi:uncharacterized protein (DUF1330 family)